MIGVLLPLRIIQAVLGLAVLALSSYVAQWYDRETLTPSPAQFNYLLYVALLSVFSAAYLHFVPTQWPLCTISSRVAGSTASSRASSTAPLLPDYLEPIIPDVIANYIPVVAHPFTSLFLEFANTTLLFGGFVALAKFLGGLKFCRGNVCLAAKFDVALCAMAVVVWLLTLILLGRQVLGRWLKPGARRGRYGPVGEMSGVQA